MINIPNNVNYQNGLVLPVLVDPADPGYSELPGEPYATDSTTAGAVIGALLMVLAGVGSIVSSFRMRARRRALRVQAAPEMAAAFGADPGQGGMQPEAATEPGHS